MTTTKTNDKISFEEAGFRDFDQEDMMRLRWQPEAPLINFYQQVTKRNATIVDGTAMFVRAANQKPLLSDQAASDILTVLRSALQPAMSLTKISDNEALVLYEACSRACRMYLTTNCPEVRKSQKHLIMATIRNLVFPQIKRSVAGFEARNSRTNLVEHREEQTATLSNNTKGMNMPWSKKGGEVY